MSEERVEPELQFEASVGSTLTKKDAVRIGTFITEKAGSMCSAEELVALAKPKRSKIHKDFEWDDSVAGHRYRLVQAQEILRHIKVVGVPGTTGPIRAFHNVIVVHGGQVERTYVASHVVWESPDLARQVIDEAHRELAAWAKKYKEYKALGDVHGVVQTALELFPK